MRNLRTNLEKVKYKTPNSSKAKSRIQEEEANSCNDMEERQSN